MTHAEHVADFHASGIPVGGEDAATLARLTKIREENKRLREQNKGIKGVKNWVKNKVSPKKP